MESSDLLYPIEAGESQARNLAHAIAVEQTFKVAWGGKVPPRVLRLKLIGPAGKRTAFELRNESTEPFGFFCIVDRKRDPPMPP